MPLSKDTHAPTLHPVTLDADLGQKTYRGLLVCQNNCAVSITCIDGTTVTIPFPSGADIPYRLDAQIKSVNTTGTTASASNLFGLR